MSDSSITGIEEIERKLEALTPQLREKMLRKVSQRIRSNSGKRITQQTDLTGAAFTPRSVNTDDKLKNKKMLRGLRQKLGIVSISADQAVIGFRGGTEKIATEQQLGVTQKVTAAQNRASNGGLTKPATKKQAKKMIQLGFKVKKGGKTKKPSIKYIIEHYKIGQAGIIIRNLSHAQAKNEWDIVLPARSFLGVTESEMQDILQMMNNDINEAIS